MIAQRILVRAAGADLRIVTAARHARRRINFASHSRVTAPGSAV